MGRNNDPPEEGLDILDDDSDSDDFLPELVAESEEDNSLTIGNDAYKITSPAPTVPSEGAHRMSGPARK